MHDIVKPSATISGQLAEIGDLFGTLLKSISFRVSQSSSTFIPIPALLYSLSKVLSFEIWNRVDQDSDRAESKG